MKNNKNSDDDMPKLPLEQENEFKRMKLELESGAVFPDFKSANMPPEVESIFLDTIFSFQKAHENASKISIFERIGKPKFKLSEDLQEDKVGAELQRVLKLLLKNGIGFTTLFNYKNRLIYRFLTEELFDFEVDDIRIKNMIMQFVYEEFYPNHKEEIKRYCKEFWSDFLSDDHDFIQDYEGLENKTELIHFYNAFERFKILKNRSKKVLFSLQDGIATAEVVLNFEGYLKGEAVPLLFDGISKITLENKDGFWQIYHVELVKN